MQWMPIDNIPDYEMRIRRQDAFWHGEILDRPMLAIRAPQPAARQKPWPQKSFQTIRDRWMDAEYCADCALASVANTQYLGDALPHAEPNLGPEVFSAFFGTELEYGPDTSWSIPNLLDWKDVDKLQFSEDNFYWKKIEAITDLLLEKGRGIFYTGITDLHPGADAMVAFRDPLRMNMDMLDHPAEIQSLLSRINGVYQRVLSHYFDKLQARGQAISCWAGVVSSKRWYIPSNDFSCMISKEMFDEVFLEGIRAECRFTEASLYHLDGPNALQHLNSLLGIAELNAIQWVPGAGHGRPSDWIPLYQRIQAAGKGLQIFAAADEIDTLASALKPNGVWLETCVQNQAEADALLARISRWR